MAQRGSNDGFSQMLNGLRARTDRMIGQTGIALDDLRRTLPHVMSASPAGRPQRDGKIGPISVHDIYGKAMNMPNTLVGVTLGSLGHVAGEWRHMIDPSKPRPTITHGNNAVEFRDNPAGGVSALTIGNASIYSPGYGSPKDEEHEKQHTYQGEQLGLGYLPSNIAGGLNALIHGQDWHGDRNWNERGPQMTPPVPWPPKKPQ